jgi:hypothetical protein
MEVEWTAEPLKLSFDSRLGNHGEGEKTGKRCSQYRKPSTWFYVGTAALGCPAEQSFAFMACSRKLKAEWIAEAVKLSRF